ncbi:MAG: hypothetical protein J2P28_10040 [Actinobacteria bacterium]|nr:hypothetical protein [Actinomycetota bacterium]
MKAHDPATAGLLFLLGLGSVAFVQRASFNPHVLASTVRKGFAQIPGTRPGEATAAYIHRRVTLLTVIAAPWFAVLLAAPHLVRLLLPPEARFGLNGVTIVLVGTIVIGILDRLGETGANWKRG